MPRTEFHEWRQDITFPSGRVEKDVYFIKATKGNVSMTDFVNTGEDPKEIRLGLLRKINEYYAAYDSGV